MAERADPVRVLCVAIRGVVVVAADTARRFPRHTHDQFGIGVVRRGAQRSASGRGPVEARPATSSP